MRIIPAIDIIEGQCVRLSQGDYNTKKVYDSSPVDVAKRFEDAGIKNLHLVDLDGAKASRVINFDVLNRICAETDLAVDFGGGVKSTEDLKAVLEAGVKQVTAGSIAVKQPELVKFWLDTYGDQIILGADVKEGKISVGGWLQDTELDWSNFIRDFESNGLEYVISTDIATDGMLEGPSVGLYKEMKSSFPNLNVIASGGVASVADLDQLIEVGVEGVIIGKAIYEGRITLKELEKYVS